jgi:nitrate/nitrite transporter NarK
MRIRRSRTAATACLVVAALQIHGVVSLHKHDVDVHRHHSRTDFHHRRKHSISTISNVSRGGGRNNAIDVSTSSTSSAASKGTLQAMRLLYLTYYASMGALMPYLPVYFHSLGHKGTSIGLLGAVKPLTTLLAAPLWGIISDRSGNHVSTLQFTFVTSLVCQLLVGMNSNLTYLIVTVFITALLNAPVKSLIDSIVMR